MGDIGGFDKKLGELEKRGPVSKTTMHVLDAALETGQGVIHRGFSPKKDTVEQVMDIVKNLLQTYVLNEVADDLKRATPARKEKPTKTSKPAK